MSDITSLRSMGRRVDVQLSERKAKNIQKALNQLAVISPGDIPENLFSIIQPLVPHACGFIEVIRNSDPANATGYFVNVPEGYAEWFMSVYPNDPIPAALTLIPEGDHIELKSFHQRMAVSTGQDFVRQVDTEARRIFDIHDLETLKISDSPSLGSREVIGMTLFRSGAEGTYSDEEHQILQILQPGLKSAINKLRLPFYRQEPLLEQLLKDARTAYALTDAGGNIREVNGQLVPTLLEYMGSGSLQTSMQTLHRFVSEMLSAFRTTGVHRKWLKHQEPGRLLESSVHPFPSASGIFPDDRFLILMREVHGQTPESWRQSPLVGLFSPREHEIVALLMETGLSAKEIADRICISPRTAEKHIERIYQKAAVRTRSELVTKLTAAGEPG